MTTNEPRPDEPAPDDGRYACVSTPDGYVLYDIREESAWLEADSAVDLEAVR